MAITHLQPVSRPVSPSKSRPATPSKSRPKLLSKSLPVLPSTNNSMVPTNRLLPSKSLPVAPQAIPIRYENYLNILPEKKGLYISKPKTPPSQQSPTNSRLSPNPNNNNNQSVSRNKPKSVGGVNLTPLISALLLAGIKLALELKNRAKAAKAAKAAKTAKTTKTTKASRRRKTI